MNRRKISRNANPRNDKREQNPIPWKYCLLTLVCGLFLATGFFLAARQHFLSIDYSIKNSRLKKQIEELESDKRRLVLAKEIALAPGEIKRAAQKIGLQEMTASNIAAFRTVYESQEKTNTEKTEKSQAVKQTPAVKVEKNVEAKKDQKKPTKELKEEKKTAETTDKQERSKTQIAKK